MPEEHGVGGANPSQSTKQLSSSTMVVQRILIPLVAGSSPACSAITT
jgi:hypothetical protein